MELTWGTVALLILALAVGWFWQNSLRARDAANLAAMEACQRMQLQFLDGTVAFAQLRCVRDRGQLKLRRTYVFDYTAGSMERLQGFVVLVDRYVETVGFARVAAAARTANSDVVSTPQPPSAAQENTPPPANVPTNVPTNVLSLEDWRKAKKGPD